MYRDTIIPVLRLDEALELYPERSLLVYNRMSSRHQAGPGKRNLHAMTRALFAEVEQAAPGRIIYGPVDGVEEGKMSKPRPSLDRAMRLACDHARYGELFAPIIVASDLTRFIRSESYCSRTNRDAEPTEEEFARLVERTEEIPLATQSDPAASAAEIHSRSVRRRAKQGRPCSLSFEQRLEIVRLLYPEDQNHPPEPDRGERPRPEGACLHSLRYVADAAKTSHQTVLRFIERELEQPIPLRLWRHLLREVNASKRAEYQAGGVPTWAELRRPYDVYLLAHERGWV